VISVTRVTQGSFIKSHFLHRQKKKLLSVHWTHL